MVNQQRRPPALYSGWTLLSAKAILDASAIGLELEDADFVMAFRLETSPYPYHHFEYFYYDQGWHGDLDLSEKRVSMVLQRIANSESRGVPDLPPEVAFT